MEKRYLTHDEFMGLIGKFIPSIEEKGGDFIEQCFNNCDFWYNSERTDLAIQPERGSAGLGFCISCCELYPVIAHQKDSGFLKVNEKIYGPYCETHGMSAMNMLKQQDE